MLRGSVTREEVLMVRIGGLLTALLLSLLAVAPIPEKGLGIAINDRLRRAAAPRA